MLCHKGLLANITMNKGSKAMKDYHSVTPWGLKAGVLGLALSISPLSITIGSDSSSASVPVKKTPSTPNTIPPLPVVYPLDKAAVARSPLGRSVVDTIEAALQAAYQNNTELKELQATLRSKDEGVPQALAGWRPTIYANASVAGEKDIQSGDIKENGDEGITLPQSGNNFSQVKADVTLQQNLFNGGKTIAQTCQAESLVQAARSQLADKEREILFATVQAYLNVVARIAELEYRRSNEATLRKTLEATQDKFNVGEDTRTNVAQAQASLADGIAQREAAETQLLVAEATFEQVTGARPGKLKKPMEPATLPRSLNDAIEIAKKNNPAILAAFHQEKADRNAIKINDADLMPKVDLQGQLARQNKSTRYSFPLQSGENKTYDFTTSQSVSVSLRVPIYEAGAIRGKTRELREVAEQRRIAIETARRKTIKQLIEAWETYLSAKANVMQYKAQVKSNEVALEGTRQEMLVGSKIVLDVLNAQRDLVNSQLNLVRAEQQYYEAAYSVLANMGRLNALDMKLKVKRYNPDVHYQDVRYSW